MSKVPDLSPYQTAWERLYASYGAEPSVSPEWSAALARHHMRQGDEFVLLEIANESALLGLAPMLLRRTSVLGVTVAGLMPLSEQYNTHSELLAGRVESGVVSDVLEKLVALETRWDYFRMSRVPLDHCLLTNVRTRELERAGVAVRLGRFEASYYLSLPQRFDDYLAARSGKFRSHLRRVEKRLAKLQNVEIVTATDPAQVTAAFDALLEIEQSSWKHAHGTAISSVPRQGGFYRDLCHGAAAARRLHLQTLSIDGRPVAYNLGLIAHGRYSYLKTSFAESVKALGAATFLRAALVRDLINRGLRELDFPAEPYEWERQWTDRVRWHRVFTMYGPTPVGRALSWLDRLRTASGNAPVLEHVDPRALQGGRVETTH